MAAVERARDECSSTLLTEPGNAVIRLHLITTPIYCQITAPTLQLSSRCKPLACTSAPRQMAVPMARRSVVCSAGGSNRPSS